ARVLLECHRLRFASQALGIRKVDATGDQIVVQFGRHTPLEPQDVILLLQAHRDFRLAGPDRLKVLRKGAEPMERAAQVRELLGILGAAVRERAPLKP
ncbi:MAG: hypothetical protein KGL63_10410, partial [Betaproteobacteria bacterium]|nr:hypothetical protein [Betaproteobacteria bacterium]